jgi:hypothetical protein
MGFMLNGNPNAQWVGGGCRANLKSSLKITSPLGSNLNNTSKIGAIPQWANISAESKLDWEIQTLSDKVGKADRVNIELQSFDMIYVSELTSQILATMSDEDIQLAVDDVDAFTAVFTPLLEEKMNPKSVFKTIYSDTVTTDETGIVKGSLTLAPQWPTGQYNFIIHYGYDAESESSNNEKAVDFWVKEVLPAVIEITFAVIAGMASGGLGFAAIMIASAAATYDLANMATQFHETRFGISKQNVHECNFPQGGFNQTYAIIVEPEEEAQKISSILTDEDVDIISSVNSVILTNGLAYTVGLGAVSVFILLAMINKIKGGKKDD